MQGHSFIERGAEEIVMCLYPHRLDYIVITRIVTEKDQVLLPSWAIEISFFS